MHSADMTSPENFSWVIEHKLAAFAQPIVDNHHFEFLNEQGLHNIVSLTEELPQCPEQLNFSFHHIPIDDFQSPSLSQIQAFVSIVKRSFDIDEPVGVHCARGMGRTGTMLACFMVANDEKLTAQEAIEKVRKMRPGSIESESQEKAIEMFALTLVK